MKIGIDARLWGEGGVGRYIRNLCINLSEIDNKNSFVMFVLKRDRKTVEESIKNKNWKVVTAESRWHSFSEQLRLPRIINKEKIDLMHFPYFNVPILYTKPFIMTIHDLIYHHFVSGQASTLPLWLYGFKMIAYRLTIKNAVRKAKKIIAVSEFTKRDIINMLGVKEEKIDVIYEAADDFQSADYKQKDLGKYFLFVGNVYSHKNAGLLIEAFKILHRENPDIRLAFVGRDDLFYQKLKKKLGKLVDSKNVVFFDNVSDAELGALYKNAICLIRPSLMEGFSLPPLEAAANRCLVLASDIPVHREIFNGAITYFDPYSINDILSKMKKIMNLSKKEKEDILNKTMKKVREFSWEKTAEQTLKVYGEVF